MRVLLTALLILACDDASTVDPEPDALVRETVVLALESDPLPQAALSVFGQARDSVWFVGGGLGADERAAWHWDGAALRSEPVPAGPQLWWIHGDGLGQLWTCGEEGEILSRAPDGTWSEHATGLEEKAVLWGLWGSSSVDLWAVGGSVRRGGPKAVVLRSNDGGTWRAVQDDLFPADLNFYKVWGTGPDDVFIVGEGGVIMHWDGAAFSRHDTVVKDLLFTIHGRAGGPILAVGGLSEGRVLRLERGEWIDDGPERISGLNGVFVHADGRATVSGNRGLLLRRELDGRWRRLVPDVASLGARTVHAVWGDEDLWIAGGDLANGVDGAIGRIRPLEQR